MAVGGPAVRAAVHGAPAQGEVGPQILEARSQKAHVLHAPAHLEKGFPLGIKLLRHRVWDTASAPPTSACRLAFGLRQQEMFPGRYRPVTESDDERHVVVRTVTDFVTLRIRAGGGGGNPRQWTSPQAG